MLGPGILRENRLDLVPQFLVDDGLVLSGIAIPFVDYFAVVYAVTQQAVDMAGIPFGPFPFFSLSSWSMIWFCIPVH